MKPDSGGLCRYLQSGKSGQAARLPFPVVMNSDVHALKISVTPDGCTWAIVAPD